MNKKQCALWTLAVLTCLLISGCVSAPPKAVDSISQSEDYRIGPGDTLQIHVRNNPDLSMSVPVRPDGNISIPLVEKMAATNKTPTELAGDLEASLGQYIRNPLVTVIVTNFVGTYGDQVRVVGEAAQPQAMPYRRGMTLLDVMINVGGLTQFAAGNRAKLVRKVDGQEKTFGINLEDLLSGDIDSNVPIRPGDVIIVPRTLF